MSEQQGNRNSSHEEIDLGQLFRMVGKGFDRLFRGVLRIFVYFKRNAVWLAGLILAGILFGYVVKRFTGDPFELDVIVTPNFDTKNYLYDIIDEIQADIKSNDVAFFQSLGLEESQMRNFEIEITSLRLKNESGLKEETEFLELLKDFEDTGAITNILRNELADKTTRNQRLTFYFKNLESGVEVSTKILDYINSNPYYERITAVYKENLRSRIKSNNSLIRQLDILIANYTQQMVKDRATPEGSLILENQEPLDIPSLFALKNQLVQDSEKKNLELERIEEPITIVSFGRPHVAAFPVYQNKLVVYPLLLLGLFFLISTYRYLDKKSNIILGDGKG